MITTNLGNISGLGGGGGGGTVTSVSGTSNRITSTGGNTPVIDISASYVGQASITTLGTVTTGTWGTGAVIARPTMTLGSDATGDIYYRNASGVLTRLGVGVDGTVLTLASGVPSWAAAATAGWGLTGNAGTVAANNYVGTSDNIALTFRTNNTIRGMINTNTNGYWGFGTGFTPSQNVHVREDQNGNTQVFVENQTNGTNADASVLVQGPTSGSHIFMVTFPSNYTTVTGYAGTGMLQTGADLSCMRLYQGAGDFCISNTAKVDGTIGGTSPTVYTTPQFFIARAYDPTTITPNTTNAGWIGIGTATPVAPLHLSRNWNGYTRMWISNTTNDTGAFAGLTLAVDSPVTKAATIRLTNSAYNETAGQGNALVIAMAAALTTGFILNAAGNPITLSSSASNANDLCVSGTGKVGVGLAATKGYLEIKAGTTTIAPLVFTSGTNNTTAQAGAMEYNGADFFATKSGTTRGTILISTAATTEALVSDTTLTVTHNGTTYKILAVA